MTEQETQIASLKKENQEMFSALVKIIHMTELLQHDNRLMAIRKVAFSPFATKAQNAPAATSLPDNSAVVKVD